MAIGSIPVALAQKAWAKEQWLDTIKYTVFGRALARGTIHYAKELIGRKGDQVTFTWGGRLTGVGQTEGGMMDGNEVPMNYKSDTMSINVLRQAVLNPNDDDDSVTIENQRVDINFEADARVELKDWHRSRLDAMFFNQGAGNNATTITIDDDTYTGSNLIIAQGFNTITAPSTNRIIRAGGSAANDQSLTSSNTITLDLVDAALEAIQRTYPTIQPLDDGTFDLYISPEQMTDLKRDTTGKIQWYQMALSLLAGGKDPKDVFGVGYGPTPVGQYGIVNIIVSNRVSYGVNSSTLLPITTVRRALLCGKKAVAFGSVRGGRPSDKDVPVTYKMMLKDYEYYKGIEARQIVGFKKLIFSGSEDNGVMVISTYAGPHTT